MLFEKIYSWTKDDACKYIIDFYGNNWYCIINFLYFANIISQDLIYDEDTNYYLSLLNSNFLLPDWIALRLFMKRQFWKELNNLNWTDFLPFFLDKISYYNHKVFLYWADDDTLINAFDYLISKWINVVYKHNWYGELNLDDISGYESDYKILLIARWTPLQEERILKNKDFLIKNWFIVFWVWWLFDFWWWKEKRAPYFFRKMKLEWLYRLITNPKKNWRKVYNSFYLIKFLLFKI